jgi:negative regulator of sigma-B (phosphoserine phosphatase)
LWDDDHTEEMAVTVTSGATHPPLVLSFAAVSVPVEAGDVSGDCYVVHQRDDGVLLAVVDGLGHGELAARASDAAVAALVSDPGADPVALIERCDVALRGTRGAAMSVAFVHQDPPRVAWAGVGNVEAVLEHADGSPRASILLCGGVVGSGNVSSYRGELPLAVGDTLAFATDGIDIAFRQDLSPTRAPEELARTIVDRRLKADDDGLVLVSRYLGGR